MTQSDINKVKKYLESRDPDNPVPKLILKKLNDKNLMLGQKIHIIQKNIQPKILNKILFGGLNDRNK